MPRSKISDIIQAQVRRRADHLCEYCHASEKWQYVRFTVDHIVPLALGGSNEPNNLALACFHCNRRKSNHITGIDPESSQEVPLFNPRCDQWAAHCIWSSDGLRIMGVTPMGRATIATLDLNRERVINIRAADREINRHPPDGDPIQSA
ncbi:MAG: HNH endonuclease signature motif containing protein [Cyanobacteria bacterium J06627_28]